jgi:hypothetical protein
MAFMAPILNPTIKTKAIKMGIKAMMAKAVVDMANSLALG